MEVYGFSIRPCEGTEVAAQDQITFTNTQTILLTYPEGTNQVYFTGFDAGSTNRTTVPTSPDGSKGGGRRALDAEGIVLLPGGGYWISDEYGPGLFWVRCPGAPDGDRAAAAGPAALPGGLSG